MVHKKRDKLYIAVDKKVSLQCDKEITRISDITSNLLRSLPMKVKL